MGGIFGKLLFLINLIGEAVLVILIGKRAWSKNSEERFFRLLFGGYLVGAYLGGILVATKITSMEWGHVFFTLHSSFFYSPHSCNLYIGSWVMSSDSTQ